MDFEVGWQPHSVVWPLSPRPPPLGNSTLLFHCRTIAALSFPMSSLSGLVSRNSGLARNHLPSSIGLELVQMERTLRFLVVVTGVSRRTGWGLVLCSHYITTKGKWMKSFVSPHFTSHTWSLSFQIAFLFLCQCDFGFCDLWTRVIVQSFPQNRFFRSTLLLI